MMLPRRKGPPDGERDLTESNHAAANRVNTPRFQSVPIEFSG
jgi:hypothetical protein